MKLQKASRKKVKLRLNISAPSGAGKTMSALLMAKGLVGDWEKIAVIDTENESASLYEHLGGFYTIPLAPPFTPERYIEAINSCINGGMECIIIDSSSHEWNGPGGCIDLNEKLAQSKYKGNTWSAWNEITPRHDAFLQTVLQAPVHIITCTRSKMETVMNDAKKVVKVGMKDIQRDGWEYELTVSLTIERESHKAVASKDRTGIFEGKDPFMITEKTGEAILEWCERGVDTEAEIKEAILKLDNCFTKEELTLFKETLPSYIVSSEAFKLAGGKRFKEISTPATTA
jgi:hypothetical protein